MKQINALIVDDERASRELLKEVLKEYCPQVHVLGEANCVDDAYDLIQELKPNLLFLDIQMPIQTGFDLLKKIKNINFEVIFVTGFDQFAIKAIKYHALDYLLKPIDIDELELAITRVEKRFSSTADESYLRKMIQGLNNKNSLYKNIAIVSSEGREFVQVDDILRCEADASCTWLYLNNGGKILSTKNLGEYEKILPSVADDEESIFYRVHHGQLVNLSYLKKINSKDCTLELKDGSHVNIAQRRLASFIKLLKEKSHF